MDDQTSWTPGDLPKPPQPAAPSWSTPSAPAAPDGSFHQGSPSPGSPYQGSPYPPAAGPSPYSPPQPTGYPPPTTGPAYAAPAVPTLGYPGPAAPGYPPMPGQPFGQPYGAPYGPYPMPAADPGTDGFAIAALVFGILGGWLALIFGFIALSRIKKSGARGRGMAIAGLSIGAAWIVIGILAAVAIPVFVNQRHEALHNQCAGGDMAACDQLYNSSAAGSDDKDFGNTCGGRTEGGYLCTSIGAVTYGDNDHLDSLWDACAGGDGAACDELSWSAAPDSTYAQYGQTCGGRTDGRTDCVDALSQDDSST